MSHSLTAGFHTLEWKFTKDGSVSRWRDRMWIDNMSITNMVGGGHGETKTHYHDTKLYLYNSSASQLSYNDDYNDIAGQNFLWSRIIRTGLSGSASYYARAQAYSGSSRIPNYTIRVLTPYTYTEHFGSGGPSGGNPEGFYTAGHKPWMGYPNSTYPYHVRNEPIGHNQWSAIYTDIVTAGSTTVQFSSLVRSEGNYDYVRFYIDGAQVWYNSGYSQGWVYPAFTISAAGSHRLEWRYTKDGSVNRSSDCTYLDWLTITNFLKFDAPIIYD